MLNPGISRSSLLVSEVRRPTLREWPDRVAGLERLLSGEVGDGLQQKQRS